MREREREGRKERERRSYLVLFTAVAVHLVHIRGALPTKHSIRNMVTGFLRLSWGSCGFEKAGVRESALTWLEFPVQFSGMSQSFTASRHTTPMYSICSHRPCQTVQTR